MYLAFNFVCEGLGDVWHRAVQEGKQEAAEGKGKGPSRDTAVKLPPILPTRGIQENINMCFVVGPCFSCFFYCFFHCCFPFVSSLFLFSLFANFSLFLMDSEFCFRIRSPLGSGSVFFDSLID